MRKIIFVFLFIFAVFSQKINAQYINESFEGTFPLPGWLITPSNGSHWSQQNDGYYHHPHSGSKFINFDYDVNNDLTDIGWLISNSVHLIAGEQIAFSVWIEADDANIKLTVGSSQNTECETDYVTILNKTGFSSNGYQKITGYYIIPITGNYFFGINIYHTTRNVYLDDFIVETAPSCLPPTGLLVDRLSETTANVSWHDNNIGTNNNFLIEWLGGSNNTWQSYTTTASINQYQITGLNPGTYYQWRISTICNATTSLTTQGNGFHTKCAAVDQFVENFENYSDGYYPYCWSKLTEPIQTYGWKLKVDDNSWDGKVLRMSIAFDGRGGRHLDLYAISPKIQSLDNHLLKFRIKHYSDVNLPLEIGTMSDPYDASTYTPKQIVVGQGEHMLLFNTASTDQYIVFKETWNQDDFYINIDDISWEPAPDCIAPYRLAINNLTRTTVELYWEDIIDNNTTYTVEWRKIGETWQSATTVAGVNTYQLTGLNPNTEYEWRVAKNCNSSNSSFTDGNNFTTLNECNPIYDGINIQNRYLNSAILSWRNPSQNLTYLLQWKETSASTWQNVIVDSNNSMNQDQKIIYELTGLQSNTGYEIKVNSICPDGSYGNEISNQFTTCDYIGDFDTSQSGYDCWNMISINKYDIYTTSSNFLSLEDNTPHHQNIFFISPPLIDLPNQNHRLRLFIDENTFEIFEIGTMSDPTDTFSFTTVETFNNLHLNKEEIIVNFDDFTTNDYIAIKVKSENNRYSRLWIDSIIWEPIPTCFAPENVKLTDYNTDTANISWEHNNQNTSNVSYVIEWKPENSNTWLTATTLNNATDYQITGLTPNTRYQWRIKTDCGSEDSRYIEGENFKTLCNTVLDNFTENFDTTAVGNIPDCWTAFDEIAINSYDVKVIQLYGSINSRVIECKTVLPNDNIFLVTPNISTLASQNHRLKVKISNEFYPVSIGTLETLFDANSFTPILTTEIHNNYKEYIVYFDQPTTAEYIAFKGKGFKLDDVVWEPIPTCIVPENLKVNFVGQTTAQVSWTTSVNGTTAYLVEWRSFCDSSWNSFTTNIGDNSYLIDNLNPNEEYLWRVSALCDNTNITQGENFTTQCLSINDYPYIESFDDYKIPSCWSFIKPDVEVWNNSIVDVDFTNEAYLNNALKFCNVSYDLDYLASELISEPFDITQLSNPMLSFYYKKETGGSFELSVSTNGGQSFTTVVQNLPDQNDWTQMNIDLTPYTSNQLVIKYRISHNNTNFSDHLTYVYLDEFEIGENTSGVTNITKNGFTYYPNPVNDILHINSNKKIKAVSIYNILGQKVLEVNINTEKVEIDTRSLRKGIYFAIIKNENELNSIKFIKS